MQISTSEVNNDPISTENNPFTSIIIGDRVQIISPDNITYYSGSITNLHRDGKVPVHYDKAQNGSM